jgi:hypothetical protein
VVHGRFAGQPMLGVIECKDWADTGGEFGNQHNSCSAGA